MINRIMLRIRPPCLKPWIALACALASSVQAMPMTAFSGEGHEQPEIELAALAEGVAMAPSQQRIRLAMQNLSQKQYAQALLIAREVVAEEPKNPLGYSLQAAAYAGNQDAQNARRSLLTALQIAPTDTTALINLAQLDLRAGDGQAARERLQTVLNGNPDHLAAMLGMARIAITRKRPDEALRWLEHASRAHPDSPLPGLALGETHLGMRDFPRATEHLNAALKSAPSHPVLLEALGRVHLAAGENGAALRIFTRLVSAHPTWALAHQRLASAHMTGGNQTAALASLRSAARLDPANIDTQAALGTLELSTGRLADAAKRADQITQLAPASHLGPMLAGDTLLAKQDLAQAQRAYESAWALGQSSTLVVKLHAVRSRAGQAVQAEADLLQWLDTRPGDDLVRDYLAGIYFRSARTDLAIEQYQRLLRSNPRNLIALNNLAMAFHRKGDVRAVTLAEEALMLAPESAAIADTLGWILYERGQLARALEVLRTAASLGPGIPEIRYHLAVALAKSGDKRAARTELGTLLKTFPAFAQRDAAQTLLQSL